MDTQIDSMATYYKLETLLFLNRIYYHGIILEREGASFNSADFRRMSQVLKRSHLNQQVYMVFVFAGFSGQVSLASVDRLFKVSGVKDLLFKTPFSSTLFRVLAKEGSLTKAEVADAIARGMQDDDFKLAVAALFR